MRLVLPAKIFEIKGLADGETIFKRLHFREEAPYRTEDGGEPTLVTEVLDLNRRDDLIEGIFSRDFVRRRLHRRRAVEAPVTEEAPFWIKPFGGRAFLIVMAPSVARGVKKLLTDHVAGRLSEVIFGEPWQIVEARITPDALRGLHESNAGATKLIWFDDIDIPSVDKLCLAGSSLADTGLYRDYLAHGKIWYVVFEVLKRGIVVGVTRNCVVTLFSKSTVEEFVRYVMEDFLALVE